ncbi:hypothetical protein [Schaalia sp. lx-100]|uniref:hypothetical protein n=1 Tax=Schaalia sp. lx-100 TaxID=2899081 RepID=UPI001E35A2C5|nr:hypothetical protein [Schaalia sp. lx-100]MCD4558117.1 hypothetical protein [Schaalia sp. lx-100]
MKWKSIISEAWRNTITGTSKTILWLSIFTLLMTIGSLAEIAHTHTITTAAEEYVRAGGSISVIQSPENIDGAACEALNALPQVRAAGAIKTQESRITLTVLPSAPIPQALVSPTFSKVVSAQTSGLPGIIVSDQVRSQLPMKIGDSFPTVGGEVMISGTYDYPEDGRASGYGYMALIPTASETTYDQCWVDIWPQSPQVQALLTSVVKNSRRDERSQTTMEQLNSRLGARFDGQARFQTRNTRFLVWIVGALSLCAGIIALRTRRLEFASALHAGAQRQDIRRIIACETLMWLLPAVAFTECVSVCVIASLGALSDTALYVLVHRIVWSSCVCCVIGLCIGWIFTREKHLFTYFKVR